MISGFATVWAHRDIFLEGLGTTVWLSLTAALASLLLGAFLSTALMARSNPVRRAARLFVDTMRCVPFLLFAYLVYYGLPSIGIRFSNLSSGLLALVLHNSAYMAELLRAAWEGLPHETVEAGHALGFGGFRLFRRIILPPVIFASVPMIGNQIIQIIKDTAFLMIIAVPELTHAASAVQSTYYVPFAAFIAAVLLYWILCMIVEMGVTAIGRVAEARR